MSYMSRATVRGNLSRNPPPQSPNGAYQGGAIAEVRQKLITAANNTGCTVSRVLTLPGDLGVCAERFKQEWPDAEIIGIDDLQAVVLRADTKHVSALYHTNFDHMAQGINPRVRVMRGRGEMAFPILRQVEVNYGQFDLAYLDTGRLPTAAMLSGMRSVIDKFIVPRGIVGITVSATQRTGKDVIEQVLTATGLTLLTHHQYAFLDKTMVLVVGSKY